MSISRCVYFHSAAAPTAERWLDAARAAGFDVDFETDFALDEADAPDGFLPVTLDGVEAGFELFLDDVEEDEPPDHLRAAIADRDVRAAFVTHSDMRGLATAVIAAAALAALTGGLVHDEESGEIIRGDAALAHAKNMLDELRPNL